MYILSSVNLSLSRHKNVEIHLKKICTLNCDFSGNADLSIL